jgi:WD40 repeat protein
MLLALILGVPVGVRAQSGASGEICPAAPVQAGRPGYTPGGIVLTSFDRAALWVYDIDSGRRYPLPETTPCGRACRLSPDATTLIYYNTLTRAFNRMRVDGTARTLVSEYAADIEWWSPDTLLIWTPGHRVYLRALDGTAREYFDAAGLISIQPGGRWGVLLTAEGGADGEFQRFVLNLELLGMEAQGISDGRFALGPDRTYFNAQSWSPDGEWLAYVAPVFDENGGLRGSELFGFRPSDRAAQQWTRLIDGIGRARINGLSVGEIAWSPDSTRIAFWAAPMTTEDPTEAGEAALYLYDLTTGETRSFCGFRTIEHTPNPPRLVWSPDGTQIALGGNIPGDDRGYLLMALDVESGVFTVLSEGIYPAFGAPDVVAWGTRGG